MQSVNRELKKKDTLRGYLKQKQRWIFSRMCHTKPNKYLLSNIVKYSLWYFTEKFFTTGIMLCTHFSYTYFIRFKEFACWVPSWCSRLSLALSLQALGSLLWHKFDSWPRNFYIPRVQPKKCLTFSHSIEMII